MTRVRRSFGFFVALVMVLGTGVLAAAPPAAAVIITVPAPVVPDQAVAMVAHQFKSVTLTRSPTFSGSDPCSTSVRFSATSALPPGLELTQHGELLGAPTALGAQPFTIAAKIDYQEDSGPDHIECTSPTDTATITVTVAASPLVLTAQSIPNPQYGLPYAEAPFTASGGAAPYTWSLVSGPTGLGLGVDAASGEITGIPTRAFCKCRFVVRATDAEGRSNQQEVFLYPYHAIAWQRVYYVPGQAMSVSLQVFPCAGCPPGVAYFWEPLTALPPGVSLTPTGVLQGTIEGGSSWVIEVSATSSSASCPGGLGCDGDEYERVWVHTDTSVVSFVPDYRPILSMTAPDLVKHPHAPAITGILTTYAGVPAPDERVALEYRPVGSTPTTPWSTFEAVEITDSNGHVEFDTFVPTTPVHVRLWGSIGSRPRRSPWQRITLTPAVSIAASPSTAAPREPIVISGTVSPERAGKKVVLQRKDGVDWVNVGVTTLDGASAYSFTRRLSVTTTFRVRIAAAGGGWNAAASVVREVVVS